MTKARGWLNGHARWLLPAGAMVVLGVGSWLLSASAQNQVQARVDIAAAIEIEKRLTAVETVIPLIYKELGEIKTDLREALAK